MRQAVRDLEAELDGAVSVWEDTIRQAGDEEIRRGRWMRGAVRHPRATQLGSYKDRVHRRGWVREKLEEVRAGGGEYAGEARSALAELDEIEVRLERARGALAAAGRRDPSNWRPSRGGGGSGGDGGGGGGGSGGGGSGGGGDGGGGGGATAADEAARAEERAALNAEAGLAKGVLKGEASLLTRMTLRIASFVADMLPGPQEMVQLVTGFVSGYQDAWANVRDRNSQAGFAAGFAASLFSHDYDWVSAHLLRRGTDADVATHFAGEEGAERAYNEAVLIGFDFAERRSSEHRAKLRRQVIQALARSGFRASDEEDLFGDRGLEAVAIALRPAVAALFDKAARLRREQVERAEGEAETERWSHIGMP